MAFGIFDDVFNTGFGEMFDFFSDPFETTNQAFNKVGLGEESGAPEVPMTEMDDGLDPESIAEETQADEQISDTAGMRRRRRPGRSRSGNIIGAPDDNLQSSGQSYINRSILGGF